MNISIEISIISLVTKSNIEDMSMQFTLESQEIVQH